MDFDYESAFHGALPEAYQRLLLDVLRGDTTLFTRSDELEAAWRFVTPVLDFWELSRRARTHKPPAHENSAAADRLLARSGFHWSVPTHLKQVRGVRAKPRSRSVRR